MTQQNFLQDHQLAKCSDRPRGDETAAAVTLNGIGTKFGIYDELNMLPKHAPYVGNHGGTVVLLNIARRGFTDLSDAPELFEVDLSKTGRLKYDTTDPSGLLVAQVVRNTRDANGVTGAAQSGNDATLTPNLSKWAILLSR